MSHNYSYLGWFGRGIGHFDGERDGGHGVAVKRLLQEDRAGHRVHPQQARELVLRHHLATQLNIVIKFLPFK